MKCFSGLLIAMMVGLFPSSAAAQAGRGTIAGLITDRSDSVVAGAGVQVIHRATGTTTTARSDDRGLYSVLNLTVGTYDVRISKAGFATFARAGIDVGLQVVITLDVVLAIGGVTDSVTVTTVRPHLQAQTSDVGTALTNATVTALPLSITGGRSLENFAYAIVPSVEGNNWESNIAGGAPFTKEAVLDGTSATIQIQGHINESSPPMEAVEEFKVQTSGLPAEYGRTGGGVFNFSLKSGTNTLRGTGYGQFRHEALNANTWMNEYLAAATPAKADAYRKPRDRQKLGGISAGGPIVVNRTFAFGAFEEYRQSRHQLGSFDRTAPLPSFLNGDFSALLDRSVRLGTDPAGNPIFKGAIFDPTTKLVFPGNVIPSARISPVSRRIADIYRQSYVPQLADRVSNNTAGPAFIDPDFTQHQFSLKLDHSLTNASRLSGSIIWTNRPRTLTDQGGVWDSSDATGGPLSKARRHEVTSYQTRISHSQVLSPSLLHVGTVTLNRFRNPSTASSAKGDWPSRLGLNVPGAYGSFPQINFGDGVNGVDESDIGYGISNYYVTNVLQYNDSLSWVKGRHVFKFGGDARWIRMDSFGDRSFLEYNFSPMQTGVQGGPFANQVGFGFASFLLGEVANASQHVPIDLYGRRNYVSLFAQDDIRVSDRLTLNLGLRWESTGGWTEKNGHWANFDTDALNPKTGGRGSLLFADETSGSFEGARDLAEFGPRIGAAYRLANRVVLRGAYGIFYAPIGVNYWQGVPYGFAPGFAGTNAVQPAADGGAAFNWGATPYPGVTTPAVKDASYTQWGMVSISPDSLKAGRIQQWNGGVEYELGDSVVVAATYLGNKGTRLQSGDFQRNQPDPAALQKLLLSGQEWSWVSDPASAAAAGVAYPYQGFAGTAWMAIAPYPQAAAGWGPLFFVGSPLGQSSYHALQLTADKRMARGLAASVGYTLSRQRGDMDSGFQERWWNGPLQDVSRLDQEASVIGRNDRTHVAKGYVAWSLPFGAGRRFFANATGWQNAVLGGWMASTVFRYESGRPLAITSSNGYAGWPYPIYVNRNPNVSADPSFNGDAFDPSTPGAAGNRYFDPRAFSNPAYGALGTGPGRFAELRSFGGAYEDLGIAKEIRVSRYVAQIRLDVLNVFNRRYFADPETNIASPNFGQVIGTGAQSPRQGQIGVRLAW